ncbi:response regulator [Synechococcus sp. W70.1]|jgi:two-component system, cell cycle response regulator DivK|uniref:response regulator n=1 Tax=unclassified Synechococcus TaxID=2626047 RepID=UPI0039C12B6C
MAKVLLVEDDPANARVFEKVLQRRGGFEVLHSQDVEQILQLAQAREVDVILLDVSLAQSTFRGEAVDGIRIAQLLKGDPRTSSIPILLVTAHAMRGDRETFLAQSGADGYIAKPVVDHEEMVNQVRQVLAQAQQG